MSVFAELVQAVGYALTDLIVMLATLASKPLRFMGSARYRQEIRETWQRRPAGHVFELLAGSLVVALFVALLVFLGVATISSLRRDPIAEAEYQQRESRFNRWFYRSWEKARETR